MQKRRSPEIIAGLINSDGTIARGDGFIIQKTGTGAYVLIFATGFRIVGLTTSGITPGSFAHPTTILGGSATVSTYNTSVVATDFAFSFTCVGIQQ